MHVKKTKFTHLKMRSLDPKPNFDFFRGMSIKRKTRQREISKYKQGKEKLSWVAKISYQSQTSQRLSTGDPSGEKVPSNGESPRRVTSLGSLSFHCDFFCCWPAHSFPLFCCFFCFNMLFSYLKLLPLPF